MTIIIVILVNVCKLICRQSCGRRTHWPFAEASEQANKRTSEQVSSVISEIIGWVAV